MDEAEKEAIIAHLKIGKALSLGSVFSGGDLTAIKGELEMFLRRNDMLIRTLSSRVGCDVP